MAFYTNYPEAWVSYYQAKNFLAIDPVLNPENFSQGHLMWNDDLFSEAQPLCCLLYTSTVYSTTGSGAQFTSLAKVDTVNVTNAHVSAEGMANLTKSNFTIDMGGTGTVTYTVSNGDVKAAANADVYVEDGEMCIRDRMYP